jgi:hypothetical protein
MEQTPIFAVALRSGETLITTEDGVITKPVEHSCHVETQGNTVLTSANTRRRAKTPVNSVDRNKEETL